MAVYKAQGGKKFIEAMVTGESNEMKKKFLDMVLDIVKEQKTSKKILTLDSK